MEVDPSPFSGQGSRIKGKIKQIVYASFGFASTGGTPGKAGTHERVAAVDAAGKLRRTCRRPALLQVSRYSCDARHYPSVSHCCGARRGCTLHNLPRFLPSKRGNLCGAAACAGDAARNLYRQMRAVAGLLTPVAPAFSRQACRKLSAVD